MMGGKHFIKNDCKTEPFTNLHVSMSQTQIIKATAIVPLPVVVVVEVGDDLRLLGELWVESITNHMHTYT